MRDIKFRAWNGKRMLFMGAGGYNDFELAGGSIYEPSEFEVHRREYPLMQYTGLTDKNGIEIYDGDIVNLINAVKRLDGTLEDILCKVKWCYETACFYADELGFGAYSLTDYEVEVIGTIYQNPELLS